METRALRKIVVANWRSAHATPQAAAQQAVTTARGMEHLRETIELVLLPQRQHAAEVRSALDQIDRVDVKLGAQDPSVLAADNSGLDYLLVAYSERRMERFNQLSQIAGENEETIALKIGQETNAGLIRALNSGLRPLVCIGETSTQFSENNDQWLTDDIIAKQLSVALGLPYQGGLFSTPIPEEMRDSVAIVLEPIWGAGDDYAASRARFKFAKIKEIIAQEWGAQISQTIGILYGDSTHYTRIRLAKKIIPGIGGLMAGRTSLNNVEFRLMAEELTK